MNVIIKNSFNSFIRFFSNKTRRCLILLGIAALAACVDFYVSGLARRTFVFYSVNDGKITVEDRLIKQSPSREENIRRYAEEAILGPGIPDVAPLFPGGTRLRSLLFRDGVVYADFSEDAALPPVEGGDVFTSLWTLHSGIRRNFSFVRDVRFFIMGKAAYFEEFRQAAAGQNEKQAVDP